MDFHEIHQKRLAHFKEDEHEKDGKLVSRDPEFPYEPRVYRDPSARENHSGYRGESDVG